MFTKKNVSSQTVQYGMLLRDDRDMTRAESTAINWAEKEFLASQSIFSVNSRFAHSTGSGVISQKIHTNTHWTRFLEAVM